MELLFYKICQPVFHCNYHCFIEAEAMWCMSTLLSSNDFRFQLCLKSCFFLWKCIIKSVFVSFIIPCWSLFNLYYKRIRVEVIFISFILNQRKNERLSRILMCVTIFCLLTCLLVSMNGMIWFNGEEIDEINKNFSLVNPRRKTNLATVSVSSVLPWYLYFVIKAHHIFDAIFRKVRLQ